MQSGVAFTSPNQLQCPLCHRSYGLHHDKVEVFDCGEDDKRGLHVIVSSPHEGEPSVIVNQSLKGNPSARRHGLKIGFWCEGCGQRSTLAIAQHKGETLVAFTAEAETPIPL